MSQGESATPLGKVRGLGSAHEGGDHWLEERFTSVALLLLSLWLIFSLVMLPDLDLDTLKEWLGSAWGAIPMALFDRHRLQAWPRRPQGRGRRLCP